MTTDPLDEPSAIAGVLRPYSIRDDHPRHRGRSWRHVAAVTLAVLLLVAGTAIVAARASAEQAEPTPSQHQVQLRQDAADRLVRSAER